MLAITGPDLSRPAELLALAVTALAAASVAVVPSLYLAALVAACGAMALAAPAGRRLASVLGVWVPVSLAVVVGAAPIA